MTLGGSCEHPQLLDRGSSHQPAGHDGSGEGVTARPTVTGRQGEKEGHQVQGGHAGSTGDGSRPLHHCRKS
uniref:Uncharacterized protein n=1 Tax=uncultured marine virus TaxID=186617 RepID=A0A0F7L693_9VIRU|nr:hypothetical protein [uncultured marine virus]